MRRTYFVTALAGAYVAGYRVQLLAPGPSGAVELELTPQQAAAELAIGSLSEDPPEPSVVDVPEGSGVDEDGPPASEDTLAAISRRKTRPIA